LRKSRRVVMMFLPCFLQRGMPERAGLEGSLSHSQGNSQSLSKENRIAAGPALSP
jgi:hypothetical protein